ncbi:WD40-repeat-containing domain protein [Boletus edulis]|nr:WD40-repeat-containing domain protein [Boletus edulis]
MEHERKLYGLAVTRDGTKIISSAEGRVKVWDVESRKLVREWTCSGVCPKIAISPDDRLVAVGDWDVVTIYSMEGGQVNQSIDIGDVWCMSFSPNGGRLACGTDYDIRVYYVKTGARILGPLKGHNDNITRVVWSRDGERLFSNSWDNIRCWNSDTGEQIGHPWTGHTDWIDSLSLSPDGSTLASASEDKTVRFWDATTGDPIGQHLPHDEPVYDVSFSPSGEFVASIDNRKIYLWRVPWWGSVQSQISLADLGAPCNTVHLAQLSRFHPPPPYSTHIPGAGQVHHLDFDAVTPPSNHLTTTALVLNSLLDSPDTSATSDECSSVTPSEIDYILSGFSPSPSPPLRPVAPSTLSSPSLPIMEQQSQRSALRIGFPAVVDLTHHIIRINNQYSAVGSFGDVYRCRYLGHSVPIEVWA